jgi:hypothetical protein
MTLHNFIRESVLADEDFDLCDHDENYVPLLEASSSQGNRANIRHGDEDELVSKLDSRWFV